MMHVYSKTGQDPKSASKRHDYSPISLIKYTRPAKLAALLAALLLISYSLQTYSAGDENIKALFNLSLEELTQIVVTTPSKTPVTLARSPGVVRLYTRNDINAGGFRSLSEILQHTPGIQMAYAKRGHQLAWIRGIQSVDNNKILLLVDKIPVKSFNDGRFLIDESLPLDNVERIEILNGPGSVLYGSGSFAGVINVTTRTSGNQASAHYTNQKSYKNGKPNDYREGYGGSIMASGENWHVYGAGFNYEGFRPELNLDGRINNHEQDREQKLLATKYTNKDLKWTTHLSQYRYPYYLHAQGSNFIQWEKIGRTAIEFEYEKLKFFTHYANVKSPSNRLVTNENTGEFRRLVKRRKISEAFGADVQYPFNYGEKHALLTGLAFNADRPNNVTLTKIFATDPTEDGPKYWSEPIRKNLEFFVQDIYQLNNEFALTGGIRYSDIKDYDNETHYRFALNWVSANNYAKVLYGTAYRLPDYEDYLDIKTDRSTPAIPFPEEAYPDLQPETLKTLEFQFGHFFSSDSKLELTLYHNEYEDYISTVELSSVNGFNTLNRPFGINFEERTIDGMELHYQSQLTPNLRANINYSQIFKATENFGSTSSTIIPNEPLPIGDHDLRGLSKRIFNASLNYELDNNFDISLRFAYNSSRKVNELYQADSDTPDGSNIDSFYKIDVNARYKLSSDTTLAVYVNNLTDENIYNPQIEDITEHDSQWSKRTITTELTTRW